METSKKNIFLQQNTLFGLFVGLSFMVVSYIFYKTGRNITVNPQLSNILLLLSITGAFIGTRKYREEALKGNISYGNALGVSMYILAIAAVSYAVYLYFLYSHHSELVEEYATTLSATLQEVYANTVLRDNLEDIVKAMVTPLFLAFANIFSQLLTGFIFSLFLAGILRKNKK